METAAKKLYEGMFLIDSAQATADWDGILATVRTILERAGAEIVSLRKWDERKLVYDIGGKSRGTYILSYFKAEGRRIRDIERDVQLSEKIMRALILNTEQMTPADIEKETPAMQVEKDKEKQKAPEEAVSARRAADKSAEGAAEGAIGAAGRKSQEKGEAAETPPQLLTKQERETQA
ncbi:MAG: 30S ribosomal protein S6 [Planctomycetota bacterium]|nr:30S ribosomal protein S6 [Planctomycetota bacterium]